MCSHWFQVIEKCKYAMYQFFIFCYVFPFCKNRNNHNIILYVHTRYNCARLYMYYQHVECFTMFYLRMRVIIPFKRRIKETAF